MKISIQRFYYLATILLIAGALLLAFGLRKTITISVDGDELTVDTRALTIGSALHLEGIQVSPRDKVTPAPRRLLKNGDKIFVERARLVYILREGETNTLITPEVNLSKILLLANSPINREDRILINGETGYITSTLPLGNHPVILQIEPAVAVKIASEAGDQVFLTSAPTVIEALWDYGIVVESTDLLSLPPDAIIEPNQVIGIKRGKTIHVATKNGSITINSAASTIGEALAQAGLSLQGLDYSIPGPDKPVPSDGKIQLIRLQEEVIIEHTPVPFETEYQPSSDLDLDTSSILQPGEYGLIARRVRVRYKDGVEISRNTEDEWTAKDPKSQIVGYGTRIVKRVADTPDGPIEYWRALTMYAVSYHPVNNDYGTASGIPLRKGIVAIDRNYIPFYTRLYIPGYGEAIAADVGGGVKGRMIDLGYTNEDYVSWHQWVTVYFLWPPPDNIVWYIP